MAEVLKYPAQQPFRGEMTPYLRNLLTERQLDELLEWWDKGALHPHLTQGELVTLARLWL